MARNGVVGQRRRSFHKEDRAAREACILDAATRVFGIKGYRAARTADIAAAAAVTERTLFRYFPSKKKLYDRVVAPAIVQAAAPRELADTGRLFGDSSESGAEWERRILKTRLGIVMRSAPQFQLLLAAFINDAKLRPKIVKLWRQNILHNGLKAVRQLQAKGDLRSDLRSEAIVRAVISLNVGYLLAAVVLAPDAGWDHDAEVEATVDMLMNGVGPRR